ncbi:MAG TPA: hypothetical protein VGG28_05960, partial [Kofleriaceae bacterium]
MKRSVVILALIIAALVIHVRVIAGDTWDDVDYHARVAPPRLAAATQIHAGEFPRWWDGSSWGVPLFAEPSHGAGDPLMWIGAVPHALDLVLIFHIAWLAVGIGLWARRAGASQLAAIGAGIFAITTGIVTSAALRGALPGIADLPWIGWAALGLARGNHRALYASVIALLVGTIALAGEPAAIFDAIAIAIVVGGSRATALWLGGAIAAGLAIGGAQWIPAWSLAGAGGELHGIALPRLVELVVPGAFGSIEPARGVPAFTGGDASAWPSLFFGAPLIALALAFRAERRRDRGLVIGLGLAALIVGRGGWSIHDGAPEVHAAALAIVLAVRAARGLDGLVAGEQRARRAIALAAAVAILATWCMVALRDPSLPAIDRALFDGGIGCVCMIGAYAAAVSKRSRARYLAVALALAPSLIAVRSTEPTIAGATIAKQPRWVTDGLAAFRAPPRRVYRPASLDKTPEISLADALATLYGTAAARWGIDSVRGDDPARMREEADAWTASAHGGGQLFERLGVGLAVLPRSVVETRNMRELDRTDDWALVQYPSEPAAVTMSDWEWVADAAAAFKTLFPPNGSRGVPTDHGVLLGSGAAPDAGGIHHATTCDIERWDAGAIDLACGPPSNAYAIVSSSAIAGWSVTVDGIATPW